jgi:hypothetical protein
LHDLQSDAIEESPDVTDDEDPLDVDDADDNDCAVP